MIAACIRGESVPDEIPCTAVDGEAVLELELDDEEARTDGELLVFSLLCEVVCC